MRRKKTDFCLFVCGAKKLGSIKKTAIEKALIKLIGESDGLRYIVIGNTREPEKIAYNIARKHHLPLCIVPADFEKWGINAEGFRNGRVLSFFSPKKILIIHPEFEEESGIKQIYRWAQNHGADLIVVSGKEKK